MPAGCRLGQMMAAQKEGKPTYALPLPALG